MFHHIKIQVGIPKSFGDTNSAEQGIIASLDLTTGEQQGIAVDPAGGYIPKFAQSKGGVWSDNENIDGRILHGINDQNVLEEMTAYATAGTVKDLGLIIGDVYRIQELARNFWQTEQQIEPVYLNVYFLDAPGPQYALIYNMDIAEAFDLEDVLSRELTFTIEREPFWRPLPPGSNPKIWSFERLGQIAGREYDTDDLALVGGTGHLVSATDVRTVCEHTPVTTATTILSQNWIDIDKALIAGDAPALVSVGLKADRDDKIERVYLGANHLPETIPDESGGTINQFASLNMIDQSTNTGALITDNTCGLIQVIAAGQGYIDLTLAASASDTFEWDGSTVPLAMQLLKGHWMAFVRAGYDSTTQDLVSAQLDILTPSSLNAGADAITHTIGTVNLPGAAGWPQATCLFPMTYLGEFRLPLTDGANQTFEGTGLYVGESQTNADIEFQLIITNNDAAERVITCVDIMFIPVGDSTSFSIVKADTDRSAIIDRTGYLGHGRPGSYAQTGFDEVTLNDVITQNELRGNGVQLLPGRDNRIYILGQTQITIGSTEVDIFDTILLQEMYINIIPRWRGIRDA